MLYLLNNTTSRFNMLHMVELIDIKMHLITWTTSYSEFIIIDIFFSLHVTYLATQWLYSEKYCRILCFNQHSTLDNLQGSYN